MVKNATYLNLNMAIYQNIRAIICYRGGQMHLHKRQFLDLSKLKDLADDNFKFDENGRKFSYKVETLWEKEKLLGTINLSFSHSVFKRLVLQTQKN